MKCKIFGLVLVTFLVLLNLANTTKGERNERVKFLRPLRWQWSDNQLNGRSESSGTGRGLLKHFLTLRNQWQQPSSNVILITRPTTTQNDDTLTTTTTGAARMNSKKPENEINHNDDETAILAVNKPFKLNNAFNEKISMDAMYDYGSKGSSNRKRNNNRNKKRRNSAKRNTKRRKEIIDEESFIKGTEDRRSDKEANNKWQENAEISQTKTKEPTVMPKSRNYIMRLVNSFRLRPKVFQ